MSDATILCRRCQKPIEGQAAFNTHPTDPIVPSYLHPECARQERLNALTPLEAEMLAALELAEKWLVNCIPATSLDGAKPLPAIRAAIARAKN